ncbi:SpoIIE family protein phosphatase [bacterium BMS3Abin03]|jgi:sigma-B regulation protein RsbU (phosphoserine phosphatase)|nr:SpoIIE family protein phosphatase [bacterium BMS3Abin03]MCG6958676.1 SpoIIE family protein phosphatase [bacterium BMS3Abin03]
MTTLNITSIKNHLAERRERLNETIKHAPEPARLFNLLQQVDAALERIDNGSYGICNVCHESIEEDRLQIDPLITVCLGHLSNLQQKNLEQDLELANKIQRNLLPEKNIKVNGWEFSYHYNPAGPVSGDFCNFIRLGDDSALFTLGDVSGKGISASFMMSHLHALINSLLSFNLPVNGLLQRTNRLFCESTESTHYATMVLGKVTSTGEIEICIAGHNPPLLLREGIVTSMNATGVPVGLFYQSEYDISKINLKKGDSLLIYTDGLTEAISNDEEYGEERVKQQLIKSGNLSSKKIIDELINDHANFIKESPRLDDVTIMVIKRM